MTARRLGLLLLAVLALAVAGCGGDDSSDAVADTETTVVEETTTDDPTDDVETVPETTADELGELGGECAELAGIGARLSQSLTGQSSDLGAAADALDEIAEQVPDEIKDDYQVIAENFAEIAKALEGVDLANANEETLAKLQQATASLDSAEVKEATENVQAWVTANC